ncbi:uncharacterized protein LOC141535152 [Cotesia typhae]|uniref:uncharacterized protein LOC141535152 n=1 Tax=Cotesia typhae TaxID=2053667 RepID=UPI003D684D20
MPKQQVPKIDIMTPELAAALDRANVTSRMATYIIAALLSSLNIDCASVNFSHVTIHRAREKFRKEAALNLKTNLETDNYVLHFDGKLLSDITGTEQVDRLPIILVPKLESGTGQNQASAIIKTVKQWDINTDNIKALCSDTTASNTGIRNGACVLVEKALSRKLLYLPCRHHIFEIVLRSAFEVYWPASSGPNVPIYQRFKKKWDEIDQSNFTAGICDKKVLEVITPIKDEILKFVNNQIEMDHCRDDYRELLELSLIFLGTTTTNITFKHPGPVHHARWMAKAIYSLKIFLFRNEFHLTKSEINGLRELCLFIIIFYLKAWFTASCAITAPNNDLTLIKELISFERFNNIGTKKRIVHALKNCKANETTTNRFIIDKKNLESLISLISLISINIFESFDLSYEFIDEDVTLWPQNPNFLENLEYFGKLQVVNDVAERGVVLIEQYNRCLTKNEEQLQYLLQVVTEHRKQYPNCNKNKSNMNEDEWRAAIKSIEKQEGDGPWVVSPGDDQKSVSQEDEETLLRDAIESGDEAERERCEKKRCDKEIAKNNGIEALSGTASQIVESNTNKDEVLSLVRQFCESSTNMMKHCQESLLGAQAAVAKMEKIQDVSKTSNKCAKTPKIGKNQM